MMPHQYLIQSILSFKYQLIIQLCIFCLIIFSFASAQSFDDSLKTFRNCNDIVFAKKVGSLFFNTIKPNLYGRILGCGYDSYFIDMRSGYRQYSSYLRTGFRYRKFERFCLKQNIYVNPIELSLIKRGETYYNLLQLSVFLETLYYTFNYVEYNFATSPYKFPKNLIGPKGAKILLPLIAGSIIFSFHVRSKAERRFQKNWNLQSKNK